MEGETAWGDGIDHDEKDEADDEHAEELEVMVTEESPSRPPPKGGVPGGQGLWEVGSGLVFPDQAVAAEEEEHGHAVVAEEGKEIHRQELVGTGDGLPQTVTTLGKELVFVLFRNALDVVAVVVEHDGKNGDATHRRTFCPCQ